MVLVLLHTPAVLMPILLMLLLLLLLLLQMMMVCKLMVLGSRRRHERARCRRMEDIPGVHHQPAPAGRHERRG
jgi:hypothetical protein